MAAIPSSKETVQDPGLGVVGASTNIPVVIGGSALGTADAVEFYSSVNKLVEDQGSGTGVDFAAELLAVTGGPVGFIKPKQSVSASNGAVTPSGGGPLITLAGDAEFDFNLRVEIVTAGDLGIGVFRFSVDDYVGAEAANRTYSPNLTIPAGGDYEIPSSGVTITFPAGAYVAGEYYTASCAAAAFNVTDLDTAMDALDADERDWDYVVPVISMNNGDPTTAAGLAVGLQAKLNTMFSNSEFKSGMISSSKDGADPLSDFASVVADRLCIDFGNVRHIAAVPSVGRGFVDQVGTIAFAVRAAGSLISTDLKRVVGNGIQNGGPLPNVVKLFSDERVEATGLDDIKISTTRTYNGRPGYFITQGRIKSAEGSDFTIWPLRRVMDVACQTTHDIQVGFIGRSVRTNDDGTIDERDALRLEAEVQSALDSVLTAPRNAEGTAGHVSEVLYTIDRTNNINTTSTVISEVAIRPLGYVDYVTTTLGFSVQVGDEA